MKQECGCELVLEIIPRTLNTREYWGKLCDTHAAEEAYYKAEAKRGHDARRAEELRSELA
jgi:hypothetical protein